MDLLRFFFFFASSGSFDVVPGRALEVDDGLFQTTFLVITYLILYMAVSCSRGKKQRCEQLVWEHKHRFHYIVTTSCILANRLQLGNTGNVVHLGPAGFMSVACDLAELYLGLHHPKATLVSGPGTGPSRVYL